MLELIKRANTGILDTIPVNQDIYGMIDITGTHKNDCEPVPNTYDPRR